MSVGRKKLLVCERNVAAFSCCGNDDKILLYFDDKILLYFDDKILFYFDYKILFYFYCKIMKMKWLFHFHIGTIHRPAQAFNKISSSSFNFWEIMQDQIRRDQTAFAKE